MFYISKLWLFVRHLAFSISISYWSEWTQGSVWKLPEGLFISHTADGALTRGMDILLSRRRGGVCVCVHACMCDEHRLVESRDLGCSLFDKLTGSKILYQLECESTCYLCHKRQQRCVCLFSVLSSGRFIFKAFQACAFLHDVLLHKSALQAKPEQFQKWKCWICQEENMKSQPVSESSRYFGREVEYVPTHPPNQPSIHPSVHPSMSICPCPNPIRNQFIV